MFEEEFEQCAAARNISYAMLDMEDVDVTAFCAASRGVNEIWNLACAIAEHGPQNDMEARIVAAAVAHRLEGK